tara:strand:+ start:106 stop:357 length:252 start_codon:yes stop_codon:yes gene_type:complete
LPLLLLPARLPTTTSLRLRTAALVLAVLALAAASLAVDAAPVALTAAAVALVPTITLQLAFSAQLLALALTLSRCDDLWLVWI